MMLAIGLCSGPVEVGVAGSGNYVVPVDPGEGRGAGAVHPF